MKRFYSGMCTALAVSFALGTAAPAMAAPIVALPSAPAMSNDVVNVQAQKRIIRRHDRRDDRRGDRFERRGNEAYYHGRRGYRERRSGYREYNGWWFPPAAFITGAIIGGALAQPNVREGGNDHVSWCYDRWRSYRASDNTYQPNSGYRRECVSPYG